MAADFDYYEKAQTLAPYVRVDVESGSEDAYLLAEIYDAAVAYMEDAGVSCPPKDTPRYAKYMICIKALALDMWDNRGTQISGTAMTDNVTFQRIKNQLKLTEPVSDPDTGSGG